MLPAAFFKLGSMDWALEGVFERSARSYGLSASVIVSDTIERLGIFKLSCCSKRYAMFFLAIPRSPFLWKGRMKSISLMLCLAWVKKYVIKFSCFPYFKRYFVEACSSSASNFFEYCVKFFFRKLFKLDFLTGFIRNLGGFPNRFLKCFFPFWHWSVWLFSQGSSSST